MDAPNGRNNGVPPLDRRLSHSTISTINSEDKKPAAKPSAKQQNTPIIESSDQSVASTYSTSGNSGGNGNNNNNNSNNNNNNSGGLSEQDRAAKLKAMGPSRTMSAMSPEGKARKRQSVTSTIAPGRKASVSGLQLLAPPVAIALTSGAILEYDDDDDLTTTSFDVQSVNTSSTTQSSRRMLAEQSKILAEQSRQVLQSDLNHLSASSRTTTPAGGGGASAASGSAAAAMPAKTRTSRRGAGQRRMPAGSLPPLPSSASPSDHNNNNNNNNGRSTAAGGGGGGAVLLEMDGSARTLVSAVGDRVASNSTPAMRRAAAAERKAREMMGLQRETIEEEEAAAAAAIRNSNRGRRNRNNNNNNNRNNGGAENNHLPGAYSVPGPGAFSESPRNHQRNRRRVELNRESSSSSVASRPSLSGAANSNANASSRLLVNAVLVEDDECQQEREYSQREQQLLEQERRIAEQQAKLKAWEEELERKKRELELMTAPGAVVHAEVIKPAPPPPVPPPPHSTPARGFAKIFSGGSHGTAAGVPDSPMNHQEEEDDFSVDFHLPLAPIYTQEDCAREDAIDFTRAEIELGEGAMRFSGRGERSFDVQVAEMSKTNKRVLKHLLQRWEDFRAKKRAHALSKEWILRFARVTAKRDTFREPHAYKAMRKLKKRYVTLSAHSLEEQLLSKTLFPVPGLKTMEGCEMFYMKPARYFPRTTRTRDVIDNLNYVMNTMLEREHPCTHGIGFVANMNDWAWSNFEVNYCLQFMLTLQSFNVPVRVELFLIVNPPSWFGAIWKIMKPMLAPSFRKKVKVILRDKLHKYLSPGFEEFLPDEMEGGQANTEDLVQDFVTYRKYYEWKMGGAHYYEAPAVANSVRSGSDSRDSESHDGLSAMDGSTIDSARMQMLLAGHESGGTGGSYMSGLSFDEESAFGSSRDGGSVRSGGQSTSNGGDDDDDDDDASIDGDLSLFSDVGWD